MIPVNPAVLNATMERVADVIVPSPVADLLPPDGTVAVVVVLVLGLIATVLFFSMWGAE